MGRGLCLSLQELFSLLLSLGAGCRWSIPPRSVPCQLRVALLPACARAKYRLSVLPGLIPLQERQSRGAPAPAAKTLKTLPAASSLFAARTQRDIALRLHTAARQLHVRAEGRDTPVLGSH